MVSIITVNYNQIEVTCALLDSIRRQDWRDLEVIVVDNGSRENPGDLLAAHYPEVKFLRSERNLGFAGGNNLALPLASGEHLFFLNNDTELTKGCIAQLLALCELVPDLGAVSPLICYFPERNRAVDRIQYAGMTPVHPITARNQTIGCGLDDHDQFIAPTPTAYAHGAAMLVPRHVLDHVGPMADDFFLYYEELDWCERMRRAGYTLWVEPRARVYHKESQTVGALGALKTYFLNRNRILFMRRNFPERLPAFYAFLWLVTVPKNMLQYALQLDWPALHAFWRAVWWHVRGGNNVFEQLLPKARKWREG